MHQPPGQPAPENQPRLIPVASLFIVKCFSYFRKAFEPIRSLIYSILLISSIFLFTKSIASRAFFFVMMFLGSWAL
jgi:hypothetical protein